LIVRTHDSELAFQRKVIRACAAVGVPVQKFNDNFSHGIPDLFIGEYGWVELKVPGGSLRGPQVLWAKKFSGRPLPVILLFSDGRVFDLARCTPGKTTKLWFERNAGAALDPGSSPICGYSMGSAVESTPSASS
jgi:hypothetical protein